MALGLGLVGISGPARTNAEGAAAEPEGVHYLITIGISGNASLTFSTGSFVEVGGYHSGLYQWDAPVDASVTVTATASPGWSFEGWRSYADEEARASAPCSGTGTCTLTVKLPDSAGACEGYCPYLIRATAITRPSAQGSGVSLATLPFPDGTPRPGIDVLGSSNDGRYVLYRHRTDTEEGPGDPTVLRRLDRTTGTENLLSSDPNNYDLWASMSGDGRYVVFDESQQEGGPRVRLWDANTSVTTTVGIGTKPTISATGRFVGWSPFDLAEPVIRVLDRDTTNSVDLPYDNIVAVFSGDESTVAVGATTYDPVSGTVRHVVAGSAIVLRAMNRLSNDGRYGIGLTVDGEVYRADLIGGSVIVSPRVGSGDGDCGGTSMVLSSDGKLAYVVSNGVSGNVDVPGGPLTAAAFDYYGRYRVDFTTTPPTLTSATGIVSLGSVGGCGGVSGSTDGASLIFGTSLSVPAGVVDVKPSTAALAAGTSDGIVVATARKGGLPITGTHTMPLVWLAAALVTIGSALFGACRRVRALR